MTTDETKKPQTTDDAKSKLMKDIDRLRLMERINVSGALAEMATALVVDSIDTLIAVAKAEGGRESEARMLALAEEAETLGSAWVPPSVNSHVMFCGEKYRVWLVPNADTCFAEPCNHRAGERRGVALTRQTEGIEWRRIGPDGEAPATTEPAEPLAAETQKAEG